MELVAHVVMDTSIPASVRPVTMETLRVAMDVKAIASFLTMDADPETQPPMLRVDAEVAITRACVVKGADTSIQITMEMVTQIAPIHAPIMQIRRLIHRAAAV
jgi:hypothetical protein